MKKIIYLVLLCCLFTLASPAIAQDAATPQAKCTIADLNKVIDTFIKALQTVKDKKPDNPAEVSDFLQTVANVANETRAYCNGLVFSGNKQQVIGPVTIPAGIYRAIATTTGSILAQVTLMDGECDDRTLFALNDGEAKDGAESVFKSKGCTVLIEFSLIDANWQLSFERISTD